MPSDTCQDTWQYAYSSDTTKPASEIEEGAVCACSYSNESIKSAWRADGLHDTVHRGGLGGLYHINDKVVLCHARISVFCLAQVFNLIGSVELIVRRHLKNIQVLKCIIEVMRSDQVLTCCKHHPYQVQAI